jgi:hypothetical protein
MDLGCARAIADRAAKKVEKTRRTVRSGSNDALRGSAGTRAPSGMGAEETGV